MASTTTALPAFADVADWVTAESYGADFAKAWLQFDLKRQRREAKAKIAAFLAGTAPTTAPALDSRDHPYNW